MYLDFFVNHVHSGRWPGKAIDDGGSWERQLSGAENGIKSDTEGYGDCRFLDSARTYGGGSVWISRQKQ